MGTFTTPLIVEYLDGRNWRLMQEFDFASEVLERIVRVPAGFVTDFASIPRVFWSLLPPTGKYGKAAVIHDDAYQFPGMVAPAITRIQADRLFREGMNALRVAPFTKWTLFVGVRAFGWRTWNAYRRKEAING
jgi:Protein of unknown function (DUF1353)